MLYQWSKKLLLWGCPYTEGQVVYESTTAGTEVFKLGATGIYKIECVGGSGAAAMRGVYDDRGYGWTGGSGGAFVGTMVMTKGKYDITVGKANTNTKGQGGNSNTMNPDDLTLYPSIISGILECGGGGSGHYNSSYVGAAGAAPIFYKDPLTIELNTAGNAGAYGSGGKGSGANWTHQGGASVYEGYGKGQGCSTSEYASRRYWIAGTGGIVRITYLRRRKIFNFTVNPNPANAEVIINNIVTNTTAVSEDSIANYTVSLDGYATKSGSVRVLEDTTVDVALDKEMITVTVNPVPEDATVVLTADGYTQEGNSITAHKYSTVAWEVSREHYISKTGSLVLTEATVLDVELEGIMRTFTINPTPADAVVTINGETVNSVTLIEGSEISWSVSAEGYAEQSGTVTLSEDVIMDIVLEECAYAIDQVVFESATAGTYDVELLENGNYEVYCIAGGSGGLQLRAGGISYSYGCASGGSGSGFIGVVTLEKGVYNIVVGEGGASQYKTTTNSTVYGTTGGNSSIGDAIVAYGGGAARVRVSYTDTRAGTGGSTPTVTAEIVSTTLNTAGKSGSSNATGRANLAGGASVYEGYGQGGSTSLPVGSTGTNAVSGYVKIVWKG